MPLGLEPTLAARLVAYGPGGAGAGKGATGKFGLGRLVPETIVPLIGTGVNAVSSNVRVTLVMELTPPLLARTSMFSPPGETRSISISAGEVWLRLVSVIVALLTTPFWPATLIVE